jgi:hypothetical protein
MTELGYGMERDEANKKPKAWQEDDENTRYSYSSPPPPPRVQIVEPSPRIYRPMQVAADLTSRVFDAGNYPAGDECDFISDAVRTEKAQIALLLDQISARHAISYRILNGLQYREEELSSQAANFRGPFSGSSYGMGKELTDLEKRIGDLQRERNMEQVSLWRDNQKALTELFRQWTEYSNLTRRAKVINLDL